MKPRIKVFLDSGAYSAWTHNTVIPIKDYIAFVKRTKPHLHTYVNLDVIPGSIERIRTIDETNKSAKQSYHNLQTMKDKGLRPLPVFHQGESFEWLERMLRDGEDYIGISSAKNQTNAVQEKWLDEFFSVVTNGKGEPLVKVHGFGSAHVDIVKRLPFYSVDSAGWSIAGGFGKLYVPRYPDWPDGQPDYLATPELITVSGMLHYSAHGQTRQHTNTSYNTDRYHRELIVHWLENEVGVNLGLARWSALARSQALAFYYQHVADALNHIKFAERGGEYRSSPEETRVRKLLARWVAVGIPKMEFVFATSYDRDLCDVLLQAKAYHHLLSFWDLRTKPTEAVQIYAEEGRVIGLRPRLTDRPADWNNDRYLAFRSRALIERMLKEAETQRQQESPAHASAPQPVRPRLTNGGAGARRKPADPADDALLVHRPGVAGVQRPGRARDPVRAGRDQRRGAGQPARAREDRRSR